MWKQLLHSRHSIIAASLKNRLFRLVIIIIRGFWIVLFNSGTPNHSTNINWHEPCLTSPGLVAKLVCRSFAFLWLHRSNAYSAVFLAHPSSPRSTPPTCLPSDPPSWLSYSIAQGCCAGRNHKKPSFLQRTAKAISAASHVSVYAHRARF